MLSLSFIINGNLTMSKDFLNKLHKDLVSQGYSKNKAQTKEIFETLINNMRFSIENGHRLEIRNFGIFTTKIVKRRNLADPDGPLLNIWSIYFSANKAMKKGLRENAES